MACSAILVLDLKGKVLLARDYRGDIPLKFADRFISKVNELEDAGKLTPVIEDEGVTYLYVQASSLTPPNPILTAPISETSTSTIIDSAVQSLLCIRTVFTVLHRNGTHTGHGSCTRVPYSSFSLPSLPRSAT